MITAIAIGSPAALAAESKDDKILPGRLGFVEKLINSSSAAKHIEASDNTAAKEKRAAARALYDQAVTATNAGDAAGADKLLNQAAKTMFEAARLAEPGKVTDAKKRRDFDNRLESINALMAALERVQTEKGAVDASLKNEVNAKITRAQALAGKGNMEQARSVLDEGYVAAKVGIEKLRGGDTLVRALNFKNKEEEYDYEVDRNDTHKMLITVLLKEKMDKKSVSSMADKFIKEAEKLRKRAEKEAGKGKFADAIKTLEESTKNLVRAIRGAGIYIPG